MNPIEELLLRTPGLSFDLTKRLRVKKIAQILKSERYEVVVLDFSKTGTDLLVRRNGKEVLVTVEERLSSNRSQVIGLPAPTVIEGRTVILFVTNDTLHESIKQSLTERGVYFFETKDPVKIAYQIGVVFNPTDHVVTKTVNEASTTVAEEKDTSSV